MNINSELARLEKYKPNPEPKKQKPRRQRRAEARNLAQSVLRKNG